ncbi:MAG: SDR family oxidoreductase [Rhizobiaceae bacterium]|nr:SDR family oxidoreductase [Rhizobiaceae bacterium]
MAGRASFDFSSSSILVTGASRGIGLAIAQGFAEAGAEVWALAEDAGIVDAAAAIEHRTGARVHPLRCDIADGAMVGEVLAAVPRIDVLINNAGYQPRTPVGSQSDEAFARVTAVNVVGTWHVTRHALEKMPDGGRIIATSSIWGKTGAAEYSGYAASKHATIGLVRSLAMELGPRGITVNAVCPGWVDTEGAMWTVREIAEEQRRPIDALMREYVAAQPLPGVMATTDLVATYLFLASSAAKDITGQAINVDRGSFIG